MVVLGVNLVPAAVAALAGTAVGVLWYSKRGLGPMWNTQEGRMSLFTRRRSMLALVLAFLFAFVAAAVLSKTLGPSPSLENALWTSLLLGAGLVAASFGMNYSLTQRTLKLALIDGAFHIVQFLIYGAVLALWRW